MHLTTVRQDLVQCMGYLQFAVPGSDGGPRRPRACLNLRQRTNGMRLQCTPRATHCTPFSRGEDLAACPVSGCVLRCGDIRTSVAVSSDHSITSHANLLPREGRGSSRNCTKNSVAASKPAGHLYNASTAEAVTSEGGGGYPRKLALCLRVRAC
jgi:hypothetical protein